MITGIDHIVILCPSIVEGQATYEALLGRVADWRSTDPAGAASVFFQLDNMALELLAPTETGPLAVRLKELLAQQGRGLQILRQAPFLASTIW
jgi:catechol 2,3-dioxygenase-like lactoylglutathione lyase family enzyme